MTSAVVVSPLEIAVAPKPLLLPIEHTAQELAIIAAADRWAAHVFTGREVRVECATEDEARAAAQAALIGPYHFDDRKPESLRFRAGGVCAETLIVRSAQTLDRLNSPPKRGWPRALQLAK